MTIGRLQSPFDAVLERVPRLGATLRSGAVTAVTGNTISVDLQGAIVEQVPYLGGAPTVGDNIWMIRQGSTLLGLSGVGGGNGGGGGDYLPLAGGTLTGPLFLSETPDLGDPPLQAATKGYVDTAILNLPQPFSRDHDELINVTPDQHHTRYTDAEAVAAIGTPWTDYLPLSGGTLTGPLFLYGDPQEPTEAVTLQWAEANRYTDTEAIEAVGTPWLGQFVQLTGDTMTGPLTLPLAAPTLPEEAANKAYVDAQVGAGTVHVVDPIEPLDKVDGLLWTNPDEDWDWGIDPETAVALGLLDIAQVNTNQTGIGGGGSAAPTTLTGLEIDWTADPSRAYRLWFVCNFARETSSPGALYVVCQFRDAGGVVKADMIFPTDSTVYSLTSERAVILTGLTGAQHFYITAYHTAGLSGSVLLSANSVRPNQFSVEDLGQYP